MVPGLWQHVIERRASERRGAVIRGIPPLASSRRSHPTEKPVALMELFIEKSCPPGGLVVDPFRGSGPALEAARKLGRRAIGIDDRRALLRACGEAAHVARTICRLSGVGRELEARLRDPLLRLILEICGKTNVTDSTSLCSRHGSRLPPIDAYPRQRRCLLRTRAFLQATTLASNKREKMFTARSYRRDFRVARMLRCAASLR
jgi:hypothetical protein